MVLQIKDNDEYRYSSNYYFAVHLLNRKVFMTYKSFSASRSRRGGNQTRSFSNNNRRNNRGRTYIDPTKFINKAVAQIDRVEFVPVHKFSDFGFVKDLELNIAKNGLEHPTSIQDGAIKPILEGRDVIGLANTGTGKTAAFVLPIIQRLKASQDQKAVLIMAPTRELALQIDDQFKLFAADLRLYSALCVGGVNMQKQIRDLRRRPQVIIGTPGRLKDLMRQRELKLQFVTTLVLDEADRMLDMGFLPDIKDILSELPEERQSLCFSATITPQIQGLLDNMLKDPVTVSVRTRETSEHIEQDVIRARSKDDKVRILNELLNDDEFEKVLVFGETKFGVQKLADSLTRAGLPAEAIHGNKSQPQRQRALRSFRDGKVGILVATDVAARGLDIPNVSHVINFDQPGNYEDYIHRIGRTGRAGKTGKALTFIAG
ncbi:MAG: DEAD/DEAH box helicase [Candidatus Saccharibacteria bacterium]|jgi:ATP-dependent RNA helicase RhlE|nr:DEAD/DEAH box helicase [Patescibacteria group bacterium]